jgi:hypothetical protein
LNSTKDAIAELLTGKAISGVGIELVFWYRSLRPSMFAIRPDDPAVPIYNAAKREILTLVSQTLNNEWSLLSMFQVGRIKTINIPTIVVFVNPFASHDWADLATQIKLKLRATEAAAMDINVEFLPGHLSFLNAPETSNSAVSCVYSMRADGVPTAGTSITGLPERGIKSLGPFVTLTRGTQRWNCALTTCSFYAVRPCQGAESKIGEITSRLASSPTLQNNMEYDISYPAPADTTRTLRSIRARIKSAEQKIESLENEWTERLGAGSRVPLGISQCIETYTEHLAELRQKLRVADKMPMKLGRILTSSGSIIADNKLADWALIELTDEVLSDARNLVNKLPKVHWAEQPLDEYGNSRKMLLFGEGYPLMEFGPLKPGKWYCKTGRTSDVTGGTCNG